MLAAMASNLKGIDMSQGPGLCLQAAVEHPQRSELLTGSASGRPHGVGVHIGDASAGRPDELAWG